MARSAKQQSATLRTHFVRRGEYGAIWLSDEAQTAYRELKTRVDQTGLAEAATISRYFERFADKGPAGLDNPKMFKPVGRHKDGTGKLIQVFEFKAYQWRLYGVQRHYRSGRSFVGLCVDPDKKKDKADPALLAKCARMAGEL